MRSKPTDSVYVMAGSGEQDENGKLNLVVGVSSVLLKPYCN